MAACADIHSLLPGSGLHIVDEAFVRVHINLLGVPGTKIADIRQAMSHTVPARPVPRVPEGAWPEGADRCRHGRIAPRSWPNAATAAWARWPRELAGEIYGLDVLARQIEDQSNNTTRFLVMSPDPDHSRRGRAR